MSAPKNVVTLFYEAKTQMEDGGSPDFRETLNEAAYCACGWQGLIGDLLCDPEDETPNNFWCPRCETRGWSFD
jgi:hypothetical protein